jgi:ribulose-5-phosphate 4-epimerase/fuculose-1-phosphate aldolase
MAVAVAEKSKALSVKERVSAEEWQARVDLAACYRLANHYRMTDMIYTHISARVPGPHEHFLLNPYGLMWDEITASSLVKVDIEGRGVDAGENDVNYAGFVIHGAIHMSRHDVGCVMHTHTRAGMAVSALKDGLLPLTQTAMRFHGRVAYHDYEGVALDLDEQKRLVTDLSDKNVMILRNHGLLTCGPTVAAAFSLMFWLERACDVQMAILSANAEINQPNQGVPEHTAAQFDPNYRDMSPREWTALMRMIDRIDPSYRN